MNTARTTIRTRVRTQAANQPKTTPSVTDQTGQPLSPNVAPPPLPVLARIPDVTFPDDRSKLSLRLEWLTQLDWKRMRGIKLDSSWIAGGVLCVVLFLLLLITLNHSSKTNENSAPPADAPSWNNASAPSPGNAIANSAAAGMPTTIASMTPDPGASGSQQSVIDPRAATANSSSPSAEPNASSLVGIYYPRTPHPTPVIATPGAPVSFNQPIQQPMYNNEIRTAQRDSHVPHAPASTTTAQPPIQSARAQFDGIITNPQR
jgi:hypothetical protein